MRKSLYDIMNDLRDAIMIFPNIRPARLEDIRRGVNIVGADVCRYRQYDNGYWNITFSNEKYGNLDILSREPRDVAEEIKGYLYLRKEKDNGRTDEFSD